MKNTFEIKIDNTIGRFVPKENSTCKHDFVNTGALTKEGLISTCVICGVDKIESLLSHGGV